MRKKFTPDKDIVVEKRYIPAKRHRIPILILKRKDQAKEAPGVLWIHGGGYATGMKEMVYMGRGESAGGGLCAAVCMKARDTGDVKIAYQMPLYPMIDNFDTDSSRDNHAKIWNTRRNHMAWRIYLRRIGRKNATAYAAPARQTDYTALPPTYTFVGTAEPFYDETLTFIKNLKEAGVEASVDIYDGMYHAFDMTEPDLDVSKEAISKFEEHFKYATENYYT